MNLGTMAREITENTRSQVTTDQVWRAIIDAIDFHRARRLWWSERTFRFKLTAGRDGYAPGDGFGLPADLIEIVGERIWISLDGDLTQRVPISRIPTDHMEEERAFAYSPGEPYSWDFWEGQLRVTPSPDSSLHIVDGRYVRNIGVPQVEWKANAWVFKTPDGSQPLDTDYTSDWFQDGRRLIRPYATYLIYSEILADEAAGNRALTRWLEGKAAIEEENEGRTAGGLRRVMTLGL